MQNWIKGKCSVSVRHQCFTATFQSDTIEKKLEDGWRELVEEDESRYSNRELKRRGNRTRKRGNGGFAGVTVTVMQPLRSLTLHHQDLQAQHCVCVSVHVHAHAILCHSCIGRKILSAPSHHLFLARLLISVLIISCLPILVWVGCTFLSIHPSIHYRQPSSQPSIPHLNN